MATGSTGGRRPAEGPERARLRSGNRLLTAAALLYGIGLILHTADHVRRGTGVVSSAVLWAGFVSTAIGVAIIVLTLAGHRLAPLAASLFGIPIAAGVAAVHLLPHWSTLSDAFVGSSASGVTALSWTVVLVEIAGALAVGIAGMAALRRQEADPVPTGPGRALRAAAPAPSPTEAARRAG